MADNRFPRLVDSATGAAHAMTGRVVTVGASGDCAIRLAGRGVPARAAHFLFVRGAYQVQPLGRDVEIVVNGEPVSSSRTLAHGDQVSIARSRFVYREREDESAGGGGKAPGRTPVTELVDAVVGLLRHRDEDVTAELVASVSRLLRCDAARLVGEDAGTGARRTIERFPAHAGTDRFSSRAIDWAREATKTVLVHDVEWRDGRESMSSLEKNLVSSVLCVPLRRGEGETVGYLYLDRLKDSPAFTEEDRELCDSLSPLFSELLASLEEKRRQRETIARLQDSSLREAGGMVHGSTVMAELLRQVEKLARTDAPLLVLGETGTGKELMARFVHDRSPRGSKPFRAVNCGAIPENLIESELFGHEKGAFTGAAQRKTGLFEAVHTGTVLLDEVGELPQPLQVKLLRVLQESEVMRVGGGEPVPVDVRVIAATNRDLAAEVKAGRFRQDLFFRLNVLTVTLPPLRDREQDILVLADHFVHKYCGQFGLPAKALAADARHALAAHNWPGNVRELENVVQKAVLLSDGTRIGASDLCFEQAGASRSLKEARAEAEERIIRQTLARTRGNISLTAKILRIDRKWLMKKMEELGVSADEFRE